MLIPFIITVSAAIVGAHIAADELAYTYSKGAKGIGDYLPKWWAKPLITCPTCMASVWGFTSCFVFGIEVWEWPLAVFGMAFVNTLFNKWAQ